MSAINNESKETVTTPESQGVPSATAARRDEQDLRRAIERQHRRDRGVRGQTELDADDPDEQQGPLEFARQERADGQPERHPTERGQAVAEHEGTEVGRR